MYLNIHLLPIHTYIKLGAEGLTGQCHKLCQQINQAPGLSMTTFKKQNWVYEWVDLKQKS